MKIRRHNQATKIVVEGSGNLSTELQEIIDKIPTTDSLHIHFVSKELDLININIQDFPVLKITTENTTTIHYPAGNLNAWEVDPIFYIEGCNEVYIQGHITFDGTKPTWNPLTLENKTWRPVVRVVATEKSHICHIKDITLNDSYNAGLRVQNSAASVPGFDTVLIENIKANSWSFGVAVRGAHRDVTLDGFYSEDPEGRSIIGPSDSAKPFGITSEVSQEADYLQNVTVRNVHTIWSEGGGNVQQASRKTIIEDMFCENQGWLEGFIDNGHNGGPVTKIDNVVWKGEAALVMRGIVTKNTNKPIHKSLWVGQAGDTNLIVEGCDFDAQVIINGNYTSRPSSSEGWSRLGVVRNCTFYDNASVNAYAKISNCRFMNPVVSDPVYPNSQHDDFEEMLGDLTLGLYLQSESIVENCDFYSKQVSMQDTQNRPPSYLVNCRFYGKSRIASNNAYNGETYAINPLFYHDSRIEGSFSTNVSGQAGRLYVVHPMGNVSANINTNGSGLPLEVSIKNLTYDSVHTSSF